MKRDTAIATTETPAVFKLLSQDLFLKRMTDLHELLARRAYQLSATRGFECGHDVDDWLQAEAQLMKAIPLELSETSDALKIKVFLAGYSAQGIEIHVEPQLLFISAHREKKSEQKKETIIHSEPGSERVFRCLDLPTRIDPEKVQATLCHGELQIELAKAGEDQKLAVAAMAA